MKEIIGTSNKILEINLTTREINQFFVSPKDRRMYLGGKGLGLKLLYDRMNLDADPLGAENMLALMMGVYMGTSAPCPARFDAVTKSPLTGIMLSSSCGGPFGKAFKTAGYDGLIIRGKSEKPLWLEIDHEGVKFKDAASLWGMDSFEVQESFKLNRKSGALVIGPAGENLVRFANATSGHRFLGRGGVGAVMGSKNLKAIVAHGGYYKIVPKNEEAFKKVRVTGNKYLNNNKITSDAYRNHGTNSHVKLCNDANILPVNNFKTAQHPEAFRIAGETFSLNHEPKHSTCKPCSIMCGHSGVFNGRRIQIPEYETTGLMGSNLGIFSAVSIAEWNDLCGRLGVDTITMGAILSWLMEATEKGLIETPLKFGSTEGITKMISDIAFRNGLGNEAANGVRSLAEKYGGKGYAIHVKGLELAAYDPRGAWGLGLAYATANRGACHLSAPLFSLEATMGFIEPHTTRAKAFLVDYFEKLFSAVNSLHTCQFTSFAYMLEPFIAKYTPKGLLGIAMENLPQVAMALMDVSVYSSLYEAITGLRLSQSDMFLAGERIHVLERYMNTKMGISRKDDTLPERFLNEGRESDPQKRTVPLEKMLNDYYKMKDFDKNGIPRKRLLTRLGII